MITKEEIIKKLNLTPLPSEGGFYRETYRSKIKTAAKNLGIDAATDRTVGTAIFYLVCPDDFSALHRCKADEMFHFYGGDPVEMIQFGDDGKLHKTIMGSDFMNGQEVQVLVPAGVWQGTRLQQNEGWALLGTTVNPGFEFEDFELGQRAELLSQFPALSQD